MRKCTTARGKTGATAKICPSSPANRPTNNSSHYPRWLLEWRQFPRCRGCRVFISFILVFAPSLLHFHFRISIFEFLMPTWRTANCCAIPLLRSREYDERSFQLYAGDHTRRRPMKRTFAICGAILLAACVSFAQEKPAAPPHDMEHMHHGGFMQGAVHHA